MAATPSKRWCTSDSITLWDPRAPWPPDVRAARARAELVNRPQLRTRSQRRIFRYRFMAGVR